MIKVADYIADYLKSVGVRHVFTVPGGGSMHLVDAFARSDIELVPNLHEQASSIAAEAYGQVNGLGVCLVTTGPGGTNAITGVAGAWLDSTPMLVISGQVKTSDINYQKKRQNGFQELDIVSIVKSITKFAKTVRYADNIQDSLKEAVMLATTGRKGPVWLDIPSDVQQELMEVWHGGSLRVNAITPYAEDHAEFIAKKIREAKSPIFLIGNGARSDKLLLNTLERVGIPVLTTWKAADMISEDHRLFFGRPGITGQRGANMIQQEADLIISLGARLDIGQIGYEKNLFAPNAYKISVDVDSNEHDVDLIDCPIVDTVGNIAAFLDIQEYDNPHDPWIYRCNHLKNSYNHEQDTSKMSYYSFFDKLSNAVDDYCCIVPGSSGACSEVFFQSFKVKKKHRIVNTQGLGSMGFGVSAAIGVHYATESSVICIEGDGSFAMNTQELQTIASRKLPICIFVLNNGGYDSIRKSQDKITKNRVLCNEESGLSLPDIEDIAEAYGIRYEVLGSTSSQNDVDEILNNTYPVICEVFISDTDIYPKVESYVEDGQMKSASFSNMTPFIDNETHAFSR